MRREAAPQDLLVIGTFTEASARTDVHPPTWSPTNSDVRVPSAKTFGLVVLLSLTVVAALGLSAAPASAHPLGNFTTNRLTRIEAGQKTILLRYVLDEAELVAFRERDALAAGDEPFARTRADEIRQRLTLEVNGTALPLELVRHDLMQPAGQGGLTTLRLELVYEAKVPAQSGATRGVRYRDANQPDRIGWREITATTVGGGRMLDSSVGETDVADGLRQYPTDPSVRPLDVRSANFHYVAGAGDARIGVLEGAAVAHAGDRFVGLVTGTASTPLGILTALLVAFAFGSVHALGPGHGKTVMAAYLVSTAGGGRDAFYLGGIVSLMHTASVLALAALLATVGRNIQADRLYPGLTVAAGLLVVGVGVALLVRRAPRGSGTLCPSAWPRPRPPIRPRTFPRWSLSLP